jgi:hypothetical protein
VSGNGMQGWVLVRYPRNRLVFADGERLGLTNKLLIIAPGRHIFDLGSDVNYTPALRRIDVVGTTADDPTIIVFEPS